MHIYMDPYLVSDVQQSLKLIIITSKYYKLKYLPLTSVSHCATLKFRWHACIWMTVNLIHEQVTTF